VLVNCLSGSPYGPKNNVTPGDALWSCYGAALIGMRRMRSTCAGLFDADVDAGFFSFAPHGFGSLILARRAMKSAPLRASNSCDRCAPAGQ